MAILHELAHRWTSPKAIARPKDSWASGSYVFGRGARDRRGHAAEIAKDPIIEVFRPFPFGVLGIEHERCD